ncbi:hypothetical protein A3Q23_07905, partial [Lactobacillus johnsonii]|uniref:DUF1542 domain-containing protein n=1 Tax=Lactobacillus johnsonii TaxID=33959 RepID=UPI000BEEC7F3
ATKAKAAIDKATTNNDVATEQTKGTKAIDAVKVPSLTDSQSAAKKAIDKAAKAKNDAIDASNLTAEEKADLKKKVAEEVNKAKDNIDAATKDADVKTAQTNGEKAINAVEIPASVSKTDAINAINAALTDKKAKINGTNLTAEEKTAVINKAQKLADDAIADINKATTNDAVKTAKDTGVETINNMNVPTTSATKDAAKDAIDKAAKTKDDAIDASNLTAEEKDALKKTVAGEVQTAKAAIDAATKDADVKTAQTNGEQAINAVEIPASAAKTAAKNAIDQAAKTKDDAIDASNLTAEEKDALKKTVAGEVQTAKAAIDAATKDADVKTAQTNGEQAINAVEIPASAAKTAAKNAIDQAAKAKNDAIDASNLTAEEKDALKKTVAGEVNKAKAAIDAAPKDADVKTAQTAGEEAINKINVPATSATKDAAKNAIAQAAKAKNDAIDASNLTD